MYMKILRLYGDWSRKERLWKMNECMDSADVIDPTLVAEGGNEVRVRGRQRRRNEKKGVRGKEMKIEIEGKVTRKKSERKKNACKHEDPATVDEA